MIIAIDGPAGAGKSTVSRMLAERLGYVRLDTGALYRVVGLAATRKGLTVDDPGLGDFAAGLQIEVETDAIRLDGQDVSGLIRTPEASAAASRFAAVPAVRDALLGLQRRLGEKQNTVIDGRDIGTVVFPHAQVKIFLTAAAEERARRRLAEMESRGVKADFQTVLAGIVQRDKQDSERAVAPLKKAHDAVEVDTSNLDLPGAVDACFAVVRRHLAG